MSIDTFVYEYQYRYKCYIPMNTLEKLGEVVMVSGFGLRLTYILFFGCWKSGELIFINIFYIFLKGILLLLTWLFITNL